MKAQMHFALLAVLLLPTAVASGQSTGSVGRVTRHLSSDGSVCRDSNCTTCNSGPVRASIAGDDYEPPFRPVSVQVGDGDMGYMIDDSVAPAQYTYGGGGGGRGPMRSDCGPIWGSVQFLHAWTKERTAPPLVTTNVPAPAFPLAGDLPGADILFGGGYGGNRQSAGIVDLGAWLDPANSVGFGVRTLFMEGDDTSFFAASDGAGSPVLGRPFIDAQTGLEDAILSAYPGRIDGSIGVLTSNEVLTAEPYLRLMIRRSRVFQFDMTAGYHFTRINDGISIRQRATDIDPNSITQGLMLDLTDSFRTTNEFHGGSLGFLTTLREGRLTLRSMGKISFGNMHQEAKVRGNTSAMLGGVTAEDAYGLLALPSNIGDYDRDIFTYIPEASITMGYRLNRCIEFTAGYHLVYWSQFAGAADQIDRTLNLSQIPDPALIVGPVRPEFKFAGSDFWVQGITLGMNFNY